MSAALSGAGRFLGGIAPTALGLVFLLATTAFIRDEMGQRGQFGDERHHIRQIGLFCAGEYRTDGKITTIPGYHLLVAAVGKAAGNCSLELARTVNTALGLLSVLVFFLAARLLAPQLPGARALQYYLLPILLPFHFLAYTDVLSLTLLLASLLLLLKGRAVSAGWLGCLSLLVRQNNVAWLVFVCLYVLIEAQAWREPRSKLGPLLRRLWPSLLGIVGFGVFLWVNGAVALHERGAHRLGFHTGNVFFALFVFALVFLPSALASIWTHRERLSDPRLAALLVAGYVLFLWSFRPDHPYNQFEGFWRTDVLRLVDREAFAKLAFYVPVAISLTTLFVTRLARPEFYAVFGLALLLLVPAWVIETRYYLVPYALWLLFRKEQSPFVEAMGVAFSALLATYVLYGISGGHFGL